MSSAVKALPKDKRWLKYPGFDLAWNVMACIRCSRCYYVHTWDVKSWRFSEICPSLKRYMFSAYSAQGKMDIGIAILTGKLKVSQKVAEILYKCTLCGGCDVMCKDTMDMEPVKVFEALREICVKEGVGPLPQHKRFIESIEKNFNPYNEPHEKRLEWMPKDVKPAEKADVVYFVGCTSAYRRPEIAQATVRILKAAKVDFMMLHPEEYCCGGTALRVGVRDLAKKMIEHNIEAINKSGAKTVVTSCAGCYNMFNVKAREITNMKMNFKVLHITELIDSLIKEGRIKFTRELGLKVTYHDPCHLGRLSEPWTPGKPVGVKHYEIPRRILSRIPGVELVEMERIKENAWCCGAGGGVKAAYPEFAEWTAKERIEEAKTTGAEALVSSCPFCKTNLKDAAEDEMKIYDITELILQAI